MYPGITSRTSSTNQYCEYHTVLVWEVLTLNLASLIFTSCLTSSLMFVFLSSFILLVSCLRERASCLVDRTNPEKLWQLACYYFGGWLSLLLFFCRFVSVVTSADQCLFPRRLIAAVLRSDNVLFHVRVFHSYYFGWWLSILRTRFLTTLELFELNLLIAH